jgi:hypothetical protein
MEASTMKRKLLRLMVKLDPVKLKIKGKLEEVVAALIILDPTTDHRHVVKFLTKGLPEDRARVLVKQQAMQVNPYTFHFHSHLGGLVWAGANKDCDNLLSAQKVPCIITSHAGDEEEGEIRAFVTVGDEVHLRASPRDWWAVHEFRPQGNSLLLVARDSSKKLCRKVHYKEVPPLALMGCTVRRSVCVACFKRFLLSCECGSGRSSHHTCVFQFPSPDSAAAVKHIEGIAQGGADSCSSAFGLMTGDDADHFNSNDDHVYKMQREAGVRSWLSQKRAVAQAKAALRALPPELSLDRFDTRRYIH